MYEDWIAALADRVLPDERPGFADELTALARLRGAMEAREARLLAGVDALGDRGLPAAAIARSTSKCSQREADRRARRAEVLAQVPAAADALAQGSLSIEHVDVVGRAVEATSPEAVEAAGLVERLSMRPADLAAKDARDWARCRQSESDREAVQRRRYAARRLSVFEGDDGMTVLHGEFDPVAGAELRKALEAETNRLFHSDGGREGADEVRTAEQRRADALLGLVRGRPSAEGGSAAPAVRNQMLLMATVSDDGLVDARLPDGSPLPMSVVERLACGSDLFGAVFGQNGDPLWMGRRVRLATDGQWRMLIARDGGCIGCGADPSRCQAHHVVPWLPPGSGPTDIDNLVLVCRHHHHQIHDLGWRVLRMSDGAWALAPP